MLQGKKLKKQRKRTLSNNVNNVFITFLTISDPKHI